MSFNVEVIETLQLNAEDSKCYNCISKGHSSLYCKKESGIIKFIPKIDNILISRFIQILNGAEKYFLPFASPNYAYLMPEKKRLVVADDIGFSLSQHLESIILFNNKINLQFFSFDWCRKIFNRDFFIIMAKYVTLDNHPMFSGDLFIRLLTPHTKKLSCKMITFDRNITFPEILSKIPNFIDMNFDKKHGIEISNAWPEEILTYKKGNDLRMIKLEIRSLKFNYETLAKLIETKMCKYGEIRLFYFDPTTSVQLIKEKMTAHIEKCFIPRNIKCEVKGREQQAQYFINFEKN